VQSCEMAAQPQMDAEAESLFEGRSQQILMEKCAWCEKRLGTFRQTSEGGVRFQRALGKRQL
jgi:hypothetical protein